MPVPDGNTSQIRAVAEQVAEAAADATLARFLATHPDLVEPGPKHEVSAMVKGIVGVVTAVITFAICGTGAWLIASVNDMRVTLARVDERQQNQLETQKNQYADVERRVSKLEGIYLADKNGGPHAEAN